jgi:hypothetical protein
MNLLTRVCGWHDNNNTYGIILQRRDSFPFVNNIQKIRHVIEFILFLMCVNLGSFVTIYFINL